MKTHFSTKGAGDVSKFNTTLFIHYGTAGLLPEGQLRTLLIDNFQIWGPLDGTVNLIYKKNIAFVKYKWRSSAEFAKVAMHQQTLLVLESIEEEGEEKRGGGNSNKTTIKVPADAHLDVRWALDDANPVAVAKVKRQHEAAFVDAYTAAADALGPDAKVARMHELTMMAAHQEPGALVSQYPDTDEQYNVNNGGKEEEEGEEEEEEDVGYDEEDINDEDKKKKGGVIAELLGGYGDDDDDDHV